MNDRENKVLTHSGKLVNVIDPDPDTISILDIAHALGNQCRFGGHTKMFYSVAQHSILVASAVPDEYKFAALMHDASEAYLIDLPRPVKRLLPYYEKLEYNMMRCIADKYGFAWPMPQVVQEADDSVLELEIRAVMAGEWPSPIRKMTVPGFKFLERFYDLMRPIK